MPLWGRSFWNTDQSYCWNSSKNSIYILICLCRCTGGGEASHCSVQCHRGFSVTVVNGKGTPPHQVHSFLCLSIFVMCILIYPCSLVFYMPVYIPMWRVQSISIMLSSSFNADCITMECIFISSLICSETECLLSNEISQETYLLLSHSCLSLFFCVPKWCWDYAQYWWEAEGRLVTLHVTFQLCLFNCILASISVSEMYMWMKMWWSFWIWRTISVREYSSCPSVPGYLLITGVIDKIHR